MSCVQRFFAVLSCREVTTANFDGAFEQSPPFAETRWSWVDFKAMGGVGIDNLGGCS
jgi:hypothetical protein